MRIAPSVTAGDATCPSCGVLLWFDRADESPRLANQRKEVLTALSTSELTVVKEMLLKACSGEAEESELRAFVRDIDLEIESR